MLNCPRKSLSGYKPLCPPSPYVQIKEEVTCFLLTEIQEERRKILQRFARTLVTREALLKFIIYYMTLKIYAINLKIKITTKCTFIKMVLEVYYLRTTVCNNLPEFNTIVININGSHKTCRLQSTTLHCIHTCIPAYLHYITYIIYIIYIYIHVYNAFSRVHTYTHYIHTHTHIT